MHGQRKDGGMDEQKKGQLEGLTNSFWMEG